MAETRITSGDARTVNIGDRIVEIDEPGFQRTVETVGRIVGADLTFEDEDDDGKKVKRNEYVSYHVWDLDWSDELQAWTIPWGKMGLSYRDC
jgi:hypothetical protein